MYIITYACPDLECSVLLKESHVACNCQVIIIGHITWQPLLGPCHMHPCQVTAIHLNTRGPSQ